MFTEKLINKAYKKVCFKRRDYSINSDIWNLSKGKLLKEFNSGTYVFDPVKEVRIDGRIYEI